MIAIKVVRIVLLFFTLLSANLSWAQGSLDQTQTLQIYTNFKTIVGKPNWVLIIRDVDTGLVLPYLFEIKNNSNFWVAFSLGHNYRITASTLQFDGCGEIKNFCRLENGIISGKSMYMTLSGHLTPDPRTLRCNVRQYGDSNFTVVNSEAKSI